MHSVMKSSTKAHVDGYAMVVECGHPKTHSFGYNWSHLDDTLDLTLMNDIPIPYRPFKLELADENA